MCPHRVYKQARIKPSVVDVLAFSSSRTGGHRNIDSEPDGWARGEREGYGEPCGVISLSLSLSEVLLEGGMLL